MRLYRQAFSRAVLNRIDIPNSRNYGLLQTKAKFPEDTSFTTQTADFISQTRLEDIPTNVVHRSKRMILDTIGVGILGSNTEISQKMRKYHGVNGTCPSGSVIWGSNGQRASAPVAGFLNGVSVHSMDFDDTWHPATHPSGPVLSAVLAVASQTGSAFKSRDILTAFNVGIQVQGILLRCSRQSEDIPKRFHPPAVVGVMGSAAAVSNLLRLDQTETIHALAIAASYAGAPMANAGTLTKPFHAGKPARYGIEAALLSQIGVRGNSYILDTNCSGISAFFDDYDPDMFLSNFALNHFVLDDQDVAIKSYPAHLGMHWAIGAATDICSMAGMKTGIPHENVKRVVIKAPKSSYINRAVPENEHAARHSFQFNTCSTLLDGFMSLESYGDEKRSRHGVSDLLKKTELCTAENIPPSFEKMWIEVSVEFKDSTVLTATCRTPRGHWRDPLTDSELEKKFLRNSVHITAERKEIILDGVWNLNKDNFSHFLRYL